MAIVINGSGTVTGLAVGGLPDGTVDSGTIATGTIVDADVNDLAASKLTGALPAIDGSSLTGISGSGRILQTVSAFEDTLSTGYYVGAGTSWENVGMNVSITPSSTSSKVMISWRTVVMVQPHVTISKVFVRLVRDTSTEILRMNDSYMAQVDAWRTYVESGTYIYSPNTTAATTFRVQFSTAGSGPDSSVRVGSYLGKSFIQVSEIGA